MTILQSIILGVVEGLTEFLPISSTAHLILASNLLGLAQTEWQKMFEVVIQLGAILAVVVLYWHRLWSLELIKKLIVAFIPTGIIGFIFAKTVKGLFENNGVILTALILGGIIMIGFERWYARRMGLPAGKAGERPEDFGQISYKKAAAIGLCQSLAIIPGVSRAAATIVGGMALGVSRRAIVEFSFLLAVPTMLVASGYDIFKNYQTFSFDNFTLLAVGFIVSFLVALAGIKLLLAYVQKYSFVPFGVYRIIIAVIFLLVL